MERRSGRTQRLIATSAAVFTLAVAAVGSIGLFSLAGDAERVRADALAAAEPLARELGEVLDRLAAELAADTPDWAIGFRTDELGTLIEPAVGGAPRRSSAGELVAGITREVDALDRAGDAEAGDRRLADVAAREDRPELAAWALSWLAARTDDPELARARRERLIREFPDVRDGRGLRLAYAARADLVFGDGVGGGARAGGTGAVRSAVEDDGGRPERASFDEPRSEAEIEPAPERSTPVERATTNDSPYAGTRLDADAAGDPRPDLAAGADRIAALFELYTDLLADRRSLDDGATTYLAERVAERILVLDPKRAAQVAIARATADRPLELFADWSLGASDWIARGAPNGAVLLAGAASPRGPRVLTARPDGSGGYVGAAVELEVVANLALERAGAAQWRELGFEARVLEGPARDYGIDAGPAFARGEVVSGASVGAEAVLADPTREEGPNGRLPGGAPAQDDGSNAAAAQRFESSGDVSNRDASTGGAANGRATSAGSTGGNASNGSASSAAASGRDASTAGAANGRATSAGSTGGSASNGSASSGAATSRDASTGGAANGRATSAGSTGGSASNGSASSGAATSRDASTGGAANGRATSAGSTGGSASNGSASSGAATSRDASRLEASNGDSKPSGSSLGAASSFDARGGAASNRAATSSSDRSAPVATARPGAPFETLRPSVRALDFEERVRAEERRFAFALAGFVVALALAGAAGFTVVRTARLEGRRAREREDFVAAVTHELKTPVASIRLMAELLERGDAPPERARDFARRTVLESERLERLVDSVLRFAGTTRGGRLANLAAVDLGDALETARASVRPLADERGFELRIDAALPRLFVRAERDALVGAIGELLDNATKYGAPAAGVDVAASVRGERVRLEVSDRGPGVPEAERERVFEPFRRLGDELTRERRGIGLGLALVRATAESFGGAAGYRARAGGGACLWIELERADAPGDAAAGGAARDL
ncbi:Signal-transduction histidine kinase senX3 [Planctomycetes bacterium Pla163]|uniref:histidine kinase n=1 Tax=Rohdeia mirabilis TaxID=2528008 RepID=A0A518D3J3_9BACT|nr:Signal-transduction histidine kinase senX3 [Planctomycetes bacterium Pla163]